MFWLSPHIDDDAASSRDDESTHLSARVPQDVELLMRFQINRNARGSGAIRSEKLFFRRP